MHLPRLVDAIDSIQEGTSRPSIKHKVYKWWKEYDDSVLWLFTSGRIFSSTPPLKTFSKSCGTSVTYEDYKEDIYFALRQISHLAITIHVQFPVKLAEGRHPRHLIQFYLDSILIWRISLVLPVAQLTSRTHVLCSQPAKVSNLQQCNSCLLRQFATQTTKKEPKALKQKNLK